MKDDLLSCWLMPQVKRSCIRKGDLVVRDRKVHRCHKKGSLPFLVEPFVPFSHSFVNCKTFTARQKFLFPTPIAREVSDFYTRYVQAYYYYYTDLYRAQVISWVKVSVCFVLKFAFPSFSPPLPSGVQISKQTIQGTFQPKIRPL